MFLLIVLHKYFSFQEENKAISTTDECEQNHHVKNTITIKNWVILVKEKVSSRHMVSNFPFANSLL